MLMTFSVRTGWLCGTSKGAMRTVRVYSHFDRSYRSLSLRNRSLTAPAFRCTDSRSISTLKSSIGAVPFMLPHESPGPDGISPNRLREGKLTAW